MSNWTHGSSEETDWRRAAADHFIKVYDLDNDDEERTEGMIAGFAAIIDWYMADAKVALEPVEYPSSPQVKRCPICDWPIVPKGEAGCWEGNCSYRPHEGTAEYERIQNRRRIVGSEVKPRTGEGS